MFWLPLAIGSYFLSALTSTVDKVLLKEHIPRPAAYAFYSSLLSAGVVLFLPLYLIWESFHHVSIGMATSQLVLPPLTLLLALFAGFWFVPALYFLFVALKRCDVSRIAPIVGSTIPIILIGFSFLFLGETPSSRQLVAILLFILGGFILSAEVECDGCVDTFGSHLLGMEGHRLQVCGLDTGKGIGAAVGAAVCFAAMYFFSSLVYQMPTPFLPEFAWTRLGSALGACIMFSIPLFRHDIHHTSRSMKRSSGGLLVGNKLIGAVGFLLLNKSFDIGPVVTINALKGFEYFFVFLFSIGLTVFAPRILKESFDRHTIILKLSAIVLISFGFLFLISAQ